MKKYKYVATAFELTRECNLRCEHCSNGEAQNASMSKEVIDRAIDNIADSYRVYIVGGEPTLHIDLLDYLVNKLVNTDWNIEKLQLTTNGVILDSALIDILGRYCESREGRRAELRVSSDVFHGNFSEEALYLYRKLSENRKGIVVEPVGELDGLILSGRTKKLINDRPEVLDNYKIIVPSNLRHSARIIGDLVPHMIEVTVDGNILFWEQTDFESVDKLSFGNVLMSPISKLIDENNQNCLLTAEEAWYIRNAKNWIYTYRNTDIQRYPQKIIAQCSEKIYDRILELRTSARKSSPSVPPQIIMQRFPVPSPGSIPTLLLQLAREIHVSETDVKEYLDSDMLHEFEEYQKTGEINVRLLYDYIRVLTYFSKKEKDDR